MTVKPITELKAELPVGIRDRMSMQETADIHEAIDTLNGRISFLRAALKQIEAVCDEQCLGDDVAGRVQFIAHNALATIPE